MRLLAKADRTPDWLDAIKDWLDLLGIVLLGVCLLSALVMGILWLAFKTGFLR